LSVELVPCKRFINPKKTIAAFLLQEFLSNKAQLSQVCDFLSLYLGHHGQYTQDTNHQNQRCKEPKPVNIHSGEEEKKAEQPPPEEVTKNTVHLEYVTEKMSAAA